MGQALALAVSGEAAGNEVAWVRAHQELTRLAKQRARLDADEGAWLLRALRAATHVHLGYGSFGEYIEKILGYKPRWTEERLRVAEALEQLRDARRALTEGALTWSAAREITRVATPETEREWLDASRGKTVRQLEQLVCGKSPGDRPTEPAKNKPKQILHFEVEAETFALFRDAMAKLQRSSGGKLDDDSALLLMARHVLGGPTDEGRASYQVAMTVCETCGKGFQQGNGELFEVDAGVVEMAQCDAQHVGDVNETHVGERAKPKRATQKIPPAVRRKVLRRDHGCCVVPGCKNSLFLDVHHIRLRSEGGGDETVNLLTLCGAHHRRVHDGELIIAGTVSTGLQFFHADGTDYGGTVSAPVANLQAQAFAALRHLQFGESEIKRALAKVRESGATSIQELLRAALAVLTG